MKKLLAYLLALVMVFGLVGCSSGSDTSADAPVEEETSDTVYTVGMVCIGNEEMAYDRNFYHAADAAKEILAGKGINAGHGQLNFDVNEHGIIIGVYHMSLLPEIIL